MLFIHKCPLYATLQDEEEAVETGTGWEEWSQGKALVRPPDQMELTEAVREGWKYSFLTFKTTMWAELKKFAPNLMLFFIIQCLY